MATENNTINTWDFVVENYPNYYSSDEIANCQDLDKAIEEMEDNPLNEFASEEVDRLELKVKIYEKAIQAFLEKQKEA